MPRKKRSELREARRFDALLAAILLGLAGWSLWNGRTGRGGALVICAAIPLLVAFAFPAAAVRGFRAWMAVASALAWLWTRLILIAFYYLLLTPFCLLVRALGKPLLDVRWKDGRESYWIDKPRSDASLARYGKQF